MRKKKKSVDIQPNFYPNILYQPTWKGWNKKKEFRLRAEFIILFVFMLGSWKSTVVEIEIKFEIKNQQFCKGKIFETYKLGI